MDEIPKYRKKSKKSPPKKAKHKHHYESCVYKYTLYREDQMLPFDNWDRWRFSIGTYCPECGKIGTVIDSSWYVSSDRYFGRYHEWSDRAVAEFNEETRTLPFFCVDSIFAKYVDLE